MDDAEIVKEMFTLMKSHPNSWKDKLSDKAKKRMAEKIREQKIKDNLAIIKLLNKEKIDYVILKGISLWYFNRNRDFDDLDILVGRNDVEKVANLLNKEFNYKYERPEELDFVKKLEQKNVHDITMRAPKMIPVEIHYRIFNYLDQHNLALMSDKVILELDGVNLPCQSKELQLLEAFLHNIYHHFFVCDMQKWVTDINIILDNYDIDWKKFIQIANELKQKEVIHLTIKLLKVRLPPPAMKLLAPTSFFSYLKKPVFLWAAYFTWDRLFPPKGILFQRFHIKPDSLFFFLSYPANWVRLFFVLLKMLFKKIF
jgi:hypothetical protein